jgi:adenosine deaminase
MSAIKSSKEIPKVELHRHLELSVRHSTIRELAPQIGINVATAQAFNDRFLITEPMHDLGSVLNKFLDTQKLLNSEAVLERIAYEAAEDAYKIENVRLLELRYAPTFVRMGHENLSFDQIHRAFVRGIERAEKEFPIAVGLICIIQRILPVKEAEYVTDFAIEHKNTFIGLDLADNEVGFDSKPFAPFFARAKKAGLGITVHAGESNVPNAPRYIREAVEHLGADRIGHGVQAYRDEAVIKYLAQSKIPLELCLTSNWLTQAVPGDRGAHPIRKLMDAGVATTINSDDPGIFNIDLNQEYDYLAKLFGFTETEFKKCNDLAARASFLPAGKKQKLWP